MFCPQCGHQQVSNEIRFCSRCGLSLGLAIDLLPTSGNQLQREERELWGVGLMIATVLLLVNFFVVFGIVALPHLANKFFLWLWLTFLVTALGVGGVGLALLIRGGFFKRLKERDARLLLLKAEQERLKQANETTEVSVVAAATAPLLVEPASVTETTTRELESGIRSNRLQIHPDEE